MDFGYNHLKQQLMNSVIAKQRSETSPRPAVQVDEPKIPAEIKNEENEDASEDSDIWRFNVPPRTPLKNLAPSLQSSKPAESSFSERFSDFKTNEESPRGSYIFSGLSPIPLSSKQWQNTNCLQQKPLNTPKELGSEYQLLFPFTSFNAIQSMAFDVLVSSDQSVVVSSPTGSGKTVIFELAIVRVLERLKANRNEFCPKPKIIYMAPVKALCTERFADWNSKFTRLGVKCIELTGDTDGFSAEVLQKIKDNVTTLILTTPEKWDSVTRKWREYRDLVLLVKLFLIDEVHLLNEDQRGPTLEAVVSRMRTVQSCIPAQKAAHWSSTPLRFIAASATIPNAGDVAEWLRSSDHVPAAVFQIGDEGRPVLLTRLVLGFPFQENSSDFRFDMNLNYKLPAILTTHSNGKPSLVFCSTRKGTQQTAMFLAKNLCPKVTNPQSRKRVEDCANSVLDPSLRENLLCGVGFHHAGLSPQDRRIVEDLFGGGHLPILVSTSTLALGVNLPAHLVVVKSTTQIVPGASGGQGQEYPVAQILQMIGRAGRPQFDTTATAVIMTKSSLKEKYEKILSGAQPVESCLHRYLKEHLNAEIVLRTITDVNLAVTWLQSTYLYVRATKLPKFYGVTLPKNTILDEEMTKPYVEQYLLDLCMREVNALNKIGLITFNEFNVAPTPAGRLMAQYYIGYNTMALFAKLTGNEELPDLLRLISSCAEFSDTQLRASERTALNQLNRDRQNVTIRFQLPGRIGTKELKVNCLLQATLGNLNITDSNLSQECPKIVRLANRVAKCMVEYLWSLCDKSNEKPLAKALVNAVVLAKCFSCKLWENSPYVAKQIEKIGPTLSKNLAESGYTTFKKIASANPRDLERVTNRSAPFGNSLIMAVRGIPIYDVWVAQQQPFYSNYAELQITVRLNNFDELNEYLGEGTDIVTPGHTVTLLVCCIEENSVLHKARICDDMLLKKREGLLTEIRFYRSRPKITVFVHLISSLWVGVDVTTRIIPKFEGPYVAVEDETTVCEETEDEMLMLEYPVKSEPQSDDEDQNKVIAVPERTEDIYHEEKRLPSRGLFKSICWKDFHMEKEVIVISSSGSSSAEDLHDYTTAKAAQTQLAIKSEIESSPDSPNPGEKRKARPGTEDSAAATADTAQESVDEEDTPPAKPTKESVLSLYRTFLEGAKKMKLKDNAEKLSNLIALFGRDEVKAAGAISLAKKRSTPEEIKKRQDFFNMFGVEMEYDSDDELLEGTNMLIEL